MTITRRNYGKGHSYKDENGHKVPGVTTLIRDGLPKGDALTNWAVETTVDHALDHWDELSKLPPSERRKRLMKARWGATSKASERGTVVHDLAERLANNEEVQIPEGMEGYVKAAVTFIDEFDVIPIEQEFTVWSNTWKWAGTGDLIADLLDPDDPEPDPAMRRRVRWLLDYKTKEVAKPVYGDPILQLAAYRNAERFIDGTGVERDMIEVDRCGVVQLIADGTYQLIPVEASDDEYRTFQYAQQVGIWNADARSLVGDPIKPPRTSTFKLVEIVPEEAPF